MIKPIELTEKHKEMLLKMCRELYPEYSVIQFEDIYNYETGNLYFDNMKSGTTIHWFEFCLMILLPNLNDRDEVECTYFQDVVDSIHIVDFLYRKFKLINNDNNKKEK